jgi:ankyrin repeat protein
MRRVVVILACFAFAAAVSASVAAEPAAPLADAAERGDERALRRLLDGGADVDLPQSDGMTALHWAVERGDVNAVRRLIDAGADAKRANEFGVTPLATACIGGDAKIVELLLDAGADPNTIQRGGETALMLAARTGQVEPVQALLDRGAVVDAQERRGQTALMWAAAEGTAEVVRALLEAGADDSATIDSGFTPLLFAVRGGHTEVVEDLLAAGADVNQAPRPRRSGAGGLGRGMSPLIMAVENGHFELAARLLDAGADPNDRSTGYSPLHSITWVRKADSGDDNALPPPDGSGRLSSLDFVRVLVEHGADVNMRHTRRDATLGRLNRRGATPFLLAADTADTALMRLLVELGADPMLGNEDRTTALMVAAGIGTLAPGEEAGTEEEALEAVKLALELGGDVNAVNANGETAMHGAAYKSAPEVVKFLAEHGADEAVWNRRNKYGWTPMLIARGYRPGTFKPAPATIEALRSVLKDPDAAEALPPPKPGEWAEP